MMHVTDWTLTLANITGIPTVRPPMKCRARYEWLLVFDFARSSAGDAIGSVDSVFVKCCYGSTLVVGL